MLESIVFASKLIAASDEAVKCLDALKPLGAERVVLVHAVPPDATQEPDPGHEAAARAKLDAQCELVGSMGFETTAELRRGLPYQEILDAARRHNGSAIVLYTTAEGGAGDLYRGAVAHEVLNKTTFPVLLLRVKTTAPEKYGEVLCPEIPGHLLFPTDFSANAEQAIAYVEHIVASGCKKVTLMHVQDRARISGHLEHRLEEFNATDRERLETIKARLQKAGEAEVRHELFYGSPAQEILREAEEGDYSLIVLGSQGRGYIPEVYLGSVSHKVVCYAPAPILLIPAKR